MEKVLSLIIPTYNMEKYLNRCLDSLIIDNMNLLEVLIINDGSTDHSSEIAHEYEKKYPNTFRVIDKENGNYGSCINCGINLACGLYIRTLDADDYFNPEALSKLITNLSKLKHVDAIFTNYTIINHISNIYRRYTNVLYDEIQQLNINMFIKNNWPYGIHTLTLKRDILKHNVELQSKISYTDVELCIYTARSIKNVIFYDLNLYQYYTGREGQTVSIQSYIKNYNHIILILNRWKDNVDNGHIVLDNKQLFIIKPLITVFYKIAILFLKRESYEYNYFIKFDKWLYKKNIRFHSFINKEKLHGIPYIWLWRNLHLNYTIFPFNILLSKLTKKHIK